MVKGDRFFSFLVAQVEIGSPHLLADLDKLAEDPRVVGVRAFLWTPRITLDATQLAQLRAVAAKGMTLDIVSRGALNPKDQVSALALAVSDLGGDFGKQIELAEEYLRPFGPKVRDKVMFGNARDFYRRKPPAHTAR